MGIHTYNQQLYVLRKKKALTLKEVAFATKIPAFFLYLYERGYFRPKGERLRRLESFYETSIDFSGAKEYPASLDGLSSKENKPVKKKAILVSSILSAFMAATLVFGSVLFARSTDPQASFYGETYLRAGRKARETGKLGVDLATNATYHSLEIKDSGFDANIHFYDSNSFLHFNECHHTANVYFMDWPEIGTVRLHFRFGGDLGRPSDRCYFSLESFTYGGLYSCEATYLGEKIEAVENCQIHIKGNLLFDEAMILELFNREVGEAVVSWNKLLRNELGDEGLSFLDDFLKDREKGRKVAYVSQIVGLFALFIGLFGLLIVLPVLSFSLLSLIKPSKENEDLSEGKAALPRDWNLPFGVPRFLLLWLCRVLFFLSLALLAVGFLGKVGVGLPPLFRDETFLFVLKTTFMVTPFLRLLLLCQGEMDRKTHVGEIVKCLIVFVFLAGTETALIAVTNVWGYDFSELIYNYVPGSVFQVLALLYLIHFFLAITPSFLKGRRLMTLCWRLASLLPLGLLVASSLVSSAHLLFDGFKKNIFLSFWFPSSVISASIVAIVAIYATFFLRLGLKRRYGKDAVTYFQGHRYGLTINLVYSLILALVYALNRFLSPFEAAYYLGFVDPEWILTLIPLLLLCKGSPNEGPALKGAASSGESIEA